MPKNDLGNGNGFSGLAGLGRPGVRETTQVNILTQITIPALRFVWIWFLSAAVPFALYLIAKMFIVSRRDWSLLIGIMTCAGLFIAWWRLYRNPFLIWRGKRVNLQYVIDAILQNKFLMLILVMVGVCAVVVYIDWIVPVMCATLDQQAHIIAAICVTGGLLFSARLLIGHHSLNLSNSLIDSDSSVYTHMIDTNWELIKYLDERGELDRYSELLGRVIASRPIPINGKRIVDQLEAQNYEMDREEDKPVDPIEQAPLGILGYSKRRKGDVFVVKEKVYSFLRALSSSAKTAARAQWEGGNDIGLTMAEYEAIVDRLEAIGLLGADKRLILSFEQTIESLGLPLPDEVQDAVQNGNSSAVPSRPASVPSRPANDSKDLHDAIHNLPKA